MLYQLNKFHVMLESLPIVGHFFRALRYPLKAIIFYLQPNSRRFWNLRIQEAVDCPDNEFIPRVSGAGKTKGRVQTMHNGLKVIIGSYYGEAFRLLLKKNRGVHEPQEERVFMEVLKYISPGSTMIELGAYWGFYSMWFHNTVINPSCFLVEPSVSNLRYGQENFTVNKMNGIFIHAYVGQQSGKNAEDSVPIICVDTFLQQQEVPHVHLLHADIQGYEIDMLYGAEEALDEGRIDYLFISTHSDELHMKCLDFIADKEYLILAEHNVSQSYSVDGLVVAVRNGVDAPNPISISKKGL